MTTARQEHGTRRCNPTQPTELAPLPTELCRVPTELKRPTYEAGGAPAAAEAFARVQRGRARALPKPTQKATHIAPKAAQKASQHPTAPVRTASFHPRVNPQTQRGCAARCERTQPRAFFFSGRRGIRTPEGETSRFTVCSRWPLEYPPSGSRVGRGAEIVQRVGGCRKRFCEFVRGLIGDCLRNRNACARARQIINGSGPVIGPASPPVW